MSSDSATGRLPLHTDRCCLEREKPPKKLQDETKIFLHSSSPSCLLERREEANMDTSDDASDTDRLSEAQGWSNPDPYTALPPSSQQMDNRFDIIKLIRKARLDNAAKADETDGLKENFDYNAPENTANIAPKRPAGQKTNQWGAIKRHCIKTGNAASKYDYDGSVISEWRPLSQELGTSWFESTPSSLHLGSSQLDHEIVSFYDLAKPQEIENIVRRDLVVRLDTAFQNRYCGIEIHAFGSFASGIYLSTADIDLVLLSDTFRRTGVRSMGERKGHIHAISGFLKSTNIAVPNSIECIAHARVPILNFVDRVTGVHVFAALGHSTGYYAMISLNERLVIYGLPSELVSPRDTSMGGPTT
ncbi:hypothetical protein N7522_006462 [Penicillium canescens]|nr:hypothetical protein N7522_006462 [Penicillium canescens]